MHKGGKNMKHLSKVMLTALLMAFVFTGAAFAKPLAGSYAPVFSLNDIKGTAYDLTKMNSNSMTVLYFFNAESRPSVEGLLSLNELAARYKKTELSVLAITASPKLVAQDFAQKNKLLFPVLVDSGKVSELYDAKLILPAMCIIGPGFKIIDYIQGGGKTTSIMLERLAKRKLEQRQPVMAQALSDEAIKKNPDNTKARMIKGYAALKAGHTDDALKIFTALSKNKGDAGVLGKEGLAAVYMKKGDTAKALALADELEKIAPERAYANLVRADILYAKNKKALAQGEYSKATQKSQGEDFQKAAAYNKLGRLTATAKDYKGSRELYDKAVELDPYYVEAMANKGVSYEKEGKYDKALDAYKQGEDAIKNDTYTKILAQRAAELLALQKDAKKSELINKYVDDLVKQFKEQKAADRKKKDTDEWTTPMTVLAFVDIEEKGSLGERDGMSTVLTTQLADQLNKSGRVKVVDRIILDKLLQELKLGSSELADPSTQLKLGRILAARVLGTGVILNHSDGAILSMRLVDTETTAIPKTIRKDLNTADNLDEDIFGLNRELLSTIIGEYPIKGFIVKNDSGNITINIGSKQGVVKGTKFNIIEETPGVVYKGKTLKAAPKTVGVIEVTVTEPEFSSAKIINQQKTLTADDRIVEAMESVQADK